MDIQSIHSVPKKPSFKSRNEPIEDDEWTFADHDWNQNLSGSISILNVGLEPG